MDQETSFQLGSRVVILVSLANASEGTYCAEGSVAVVVGLPEQTGGPYRLRLMNSRLVDLDVSQFTGLGRFKQGPAPRANPDLWQYIVFRCITGSRAYGLDGPDSDTAELHWSLHGLPEQLENKQEEECYWELEKFLKLALRANPNVLECLYSPLVLYADPLIEELLAMRACFLSRLAYQTYNGYVAAQFKKLTQAWERQGTIKWKHAMHLLRLLISGIGVVREGTVPVRVERDRDRLLAVRAGELPWAEVDAWRLALQAEFDRAFADSPLPDRPDYAAADSFLVKARRAMVR